MRFVLSFLILWLFGSSCFGQKNYSVEIADWYNHKLGAISISFDDASYTQYEYAYPILEKYGFNGTFSLVGEWTKEDAAYSAEYGNFDIKKMGWRQLKELCKSGNEIAAHGYRHVRYDKRLPIDTLVMQMKQIKNLIESKLGNTVTTLHYPYSRTSAKIEQAAEQAGYLFGRTGSESCNDANPNDFYLLKTLAIWNDTIPNLSKFKTIIGDTKGKWLILMYHHLFPLGSKEDGLYKYHKVLHTYSLYPQTFENQMEHIAQQDFWVAPIAQVGKYIQERENTQVTISKCFGRLTIKSKTELDTNLYQQPLTILVQVPWKKIKVITNKKSFEKEVKNHQLMLDLLPGQKIKIKRRK